MILSLHLHFSVCSSIFRYISAVQLSPGGRAESGNFMALQTKMVVLSADILNNLPMKYRERSDSFILF